jgi:hypothetical protein
MGGHALLQLKLQLQLQKPISLVFWGISMWVAPPLSARLLYDTGVFDHLSCAAYSTRNLEPPNGYGFSFFYRTTRLVATSSRNFLVSAIVTRRLGVDEFCMAFFLHGSPSWKHAGPVEEIRNPFAMPINISIWVRRIFFSHYKFPPSRVQGGKGIQVFFLPPFPLGTAGLP